MAGCGGATHSPHRSRPFAWLRPAAVPTGWSVGRLPSGAARLAYPPGWRSIATDRGTFSAALLGAGGRIRGYLNVTPRSGAETLANWAQFRVSHNREEGDRAVVRESFATGVPFRSGISSCVVDRYLTVTSARYREIACIVRGAHATTVVVAAARPSDWTGLAPQLRTAVNSFAS
jgi:hypothetical protein